jgi:hypothetical protein
MKDEGNPHSRGSATDICMTRSSDFSYWKVALSDLKLACNLLKSIEL